MVKLTMNMAQTSMATNKDFTRSLGNVNRNYAPTFSSGTPATLPYHGTSRYSSFAEWADAVGRALSSLTNNYYVDSNITAVWSVTEELNS